MNLLTGWLAGWWPQGPGFQDWGVTQNLHSLWQVFGKIFFGPRASMWHPFRFALWRPSVTLFFYGPMASMCHLDFFCYVSSPPWQRLGLPNDAQGPTTCFITYFGLLCSNIICFMTYFGTLKNHLFYSNFEQQRTHKGPFLYTG